MARRPGRDEVVVGVARVDRRTKHIVKRLRAGEVAVIDHEDLDRLAAEDLIEAGAAAVVNASCSISGRYPNLGPLLLAAAGIPLIDDTGPHTLREIGEGQVVRVKGSEVWLDGRVVAKGIRQDLRSLESQLDAARESMGQQLELFAENTLEHLRREGHVLTDAPVVPELDVALKGSHALVVVRGSGYKDDLAALRTYIEEVRPVLIGVDGGADALLEAGQRPQVIIGDFDSVSTEALHCGAELVVHAYAGGQAPGATRLQALGLEYSVFEGTGTSEDIALLLAYEKGAELIVAVGTHVSMVDFLDKGRQGMASTFLVRLKVSDRLVDANGVSQLYRSRVRTRDLAFLVAAAFLTMLVVIALSPALRLFLRSTWELVRG